MEDPQAQLARWRGAQATYATAIHQLLRALPDDAVIAFGAHMEGAAVGIRAEIGGLEGPHDAVLDGHNAALQVIGELVAGRIDA